MESQSSQSTGSKTERWIALVLCAAVLVAGVLERFVRDWPEYTWNFAPDWFPFAAACLGAAGIMQLNWIPQWFRIQRALLWISLLLMIWVANGLPFDLFRIAGLMPTGVDWPGMATRTLALAAAVMLARLVLARPTAPVSLHTATWYGYAAFLVALPYPVLRTLWAFGSTVGLDWPGAAGQGFTPWLIGTPWLLAAALSLLLVSPWRWIPRRLLLVAGWSATAIVASIAPAACWSLVTMLTGGQDPGLEGIATWVPVLFYGSWFLWAIAACAATRSYQLRSARNSNPQAS